MKTSEKVRNLANYYAATRKVGHTTLMKEGTNNYQGDKLVLTYNMSSGHDLGFKTDEIISWKNVDKLRGNKKPIVIDNGVMTEIFKEITQEFYLLEKENKKLREQKRKILELLDDSHVVF